MSTTISGTSLLDLPPELIEEILVRCDPVDVAKASMTCKSVFGVVYGIAGVDNPEERRRRVIWRELYLRQPLDDLRRCVNWLGVPRSSSSSEGEGEGTIDWQKEIQDVIRARTVMENVERCRGEEELRRVLGTLIRLVEWVPPSEAAEESVEGDLARNLVWVPVVAGDFLDCVERGVASDLSLSPSSTQIQWKLPPSNQWTKATKQLHAQLHTLYGLTRRDLTKRRRVSSRAWVYDMRNYREENEYGPLCEGDRGGKVVDWEFLERVHHVMSVQVVWEGVKGLVENGVFDGDDEAAGFKYMIYPMSMRFTQVVVRGGDGEGGERRGVPMVEVNEEGGGLPEGADWAGIEGNWAVCFCFCDHRELIEYNKSEDENRRLDVSLFEDEEFTEVFRRLEVRLKVTRVANDPDHPGRPIIGFLGEMKTPSNSTMYGCVQLTEDNHLKWQFYSGEMGGGAIWSSVGIQVGGVGSSYGVLGSWTTVFHDSDDPVGPFWMQKM